MRSLVTRRPHAGARAHSLLSRCLLGWEALRSPSLSRVRWPVKSQQHYGLLTAQRIPDPARHQRGRLPADAAERPRQRPPVRTGRLQRALRAAPCRAASLLLRSTLRCALCKGRNCAPSHSFRALSDRPGCNQSLALRCSACRAASYCSKQCASAAWPAHRATCSRLVRSRRSFSAALTRGAGAEPPGVRRGGARPVAAAGCA